ncbi:MAG: class I SAM-dependent methyltransferase [Solirubrobacteraceae bacterium]
MTDPATNPEHAHEHAERPAGRHVTEMFEPEAWDERYSGNEDVWSGAPNPQLVTEVSKLTPGSALDVGCGEGGDVIWLAQKGWTVTGADFSKNGLARAARHAEQAGVADTTDWWQVDARDFTAQGRSYDLVTTHFLHPRGGTILDVVRRLCEAVTPAGHLLVVGHAPPAQDVIPAGDPRREAMFLAEQLLPALPDDFRAVIVEQRSRSVTRDGKTIAIEDSTLLARRL